jgi:NADH-quinone oxidoreductase subunit F
MNRRPLSHPGDLARLREKLKAEEPEKVVIVSCGTCGLSRGATKLVEELVRELDQTGVDGRVRLRVTGCLGFCDREPIVIVRPQGFFYPQPKISDVKEIVEKSVLAGEPVERLFMKDPHTGRPFVTKEEIPFYKRQTPVLFGANFELDPTSIDDYVRIGGYSALVKALTTMEPEEIIAEVTRSGLRGRGGAAFPTGTKWASCRKAEGDIKYVICNAHEGDPGAYANRGLMEGNPHRAIEGMIIGAYAIGASQGFVYVRAESPLAVALMTNAVEEARARGLLGEKILGTDFSFDIKVNRGGGAYVCGESTALMTSIEGRAGEPRSKHVHTVERGLWDKPSTLNNVETWSNIPLIIDHGAEWFTRIGTGDVSKSPWGGSKGTKIFSLVGKVNNTGLVEVPMGMTLRQIIYDIGGGTKDGKRFKGVQTGGPSGGILGEQHLDLALDYDRLAAVGSMVGSGGMIVVDEDTCVVDLAHYFISFLEDESCGKCTPCREGMTQMRQVLEQIGAGKATMAHLDLLKELAEVLQDASLCQLGMSAPAPVLTTLAYFREEYEAHIREGRCPAGVCKGLITYRIDREKCNGCSVCARQCPSGAIQGKTKQPHAIIAEKCSKCGICFDVCKSNAVVRN